MEALTQNAQYVLASTDLRRDRFVAELYSTSLSLDDCNGPLVERVRHRSEPAHALVREVLQELVPEIECADLGDVPEQAA